MSRRTEQMASTLLRAIQEIITRGLQDPRVSGLITVTGLRVSEDKREATVMVSVLPADRQELTMHGLRAAVPHIRHQLGEMVDMRNTPNLSFKVDGSLKKQAGVIAALSKVSEERERTGVSSTPGFNDAPGSEKPEREDTASGAPLEGRGSKARSRTPSRPDASPMMPRVSTRRQSGARESAAQRSSGAGPVPIKANGTSGAKPVPKSAVKSPMKSGTAKPRRSNSNQGDPRR